MTWGFSQGAGNVQGNDISLYVDFNSCKEMKMRQEQWLDKCNGLFLIVDSALMHLNISYGLMAQSDLTRVDLKYSYVINFP